MLEDMKGAVEGVGAVGGVVTTACTQEGSSMSSAVEIPPPSHDEDTSDAVATGGLKLQQSDDVKEDGWGDSWSNDDESDNEKKQSIILDPRRPYFF